MVFSIARDHDYNGLKKTFGLFEMRQTPVRENADQILDIISTIRAHKPTAPIVFTLSPVPLLVVTNGSPISANNVSKATLRVAIDEVMRTAPPNVHYWPSYEIVEWIGKYVEIVWGRGDKDLRHLQPQSVDQITARFIDLYFEK